MKSSSLIFAALLAGAASLAQAQSKSNPPVDAPMRDSTSTPQGEEARKTVDPTGKLEAQERTTRKNRPSACSPKRMSIRTRARPCRRRHRIRKAKPAILVRAATPASRHRRNRHAELKSPSDHFHHH